MDIICTIHVMPMKDAKQATTTSEYDAAPVLEKIRAVEEKPSSADCIDHRTAGRPHFNARINVNTACNACASVMPTVNLRHSRNVQGHTHTT